VKFSPMLLAFGYRFDDVHWICCLLKLQLYTAS
jgi:hypothetical protein